MVAYYKLRSEMRGPVEVDARHTPPQHLQGRITVSIALNRANDIGDAHIVTLTHYVPSERLIQ